MELVIYQFQQPHQCRNRFFSMSVVGSHLGHAQPVCLLGPVVGADHIGETRNGLGCTCSFYPQLCQAQASSFSRRLPVSTVGQNGGFWSLIKEESWRIRKLSHEKGAPLAFADKQRIARFSFLKLQNSRVRALWEVTWAVLSS
jgi:hypothetical protein